MALIDPSFTPNPSFNDDSDIVDILWGVVLCSAVAMLSFFFAKWLL
jgi:hypothetical protein